jgi:signal transduction histidine kinase
MNSLLKRQARKYLSKHIAESKGLEDFIDAISRPNITFKDQFAMQQRAMRISSEELFEVNQRLIKDSKAKQKVIDKLKHVLAIQKYYNLPENLDVNSIDLDRLKLVEFIDNQTKEIDKQRETLLSELAHQNQELSDYAHRVSHDLKSPLSSIHTLTEWLAEDYSESLDIKRKQTLDLISNNV